MSSTAQGLDSPTLRERSGSNSKLKPKGAAAKQWRAAALRARKLRDPWENLGFDKIEEETVTRHMYNPRNGRWKQDEIVVKIQAESFAHGAMRECFRMKKLSKFSQNPNWQNASNYVAKRYKKEVPRETYYDDVKLQMDSKLWGEEYSKLNIPKKVDFCQTYIIEFKDRKESPLYGVEHFIDGGYIKYNSNSGFVSDVNRLTPQTFSHFTFERSDHQLIVVDIQGVGDLYTDPQMHTVDMKDYGEANLGTRGMALFFSSHVCSPLCEILGLTQFDLSDDEIEKLSSRRWNFSSSTTQVSDISQGEDDVLADESEKPGHRTVGDVYRRLSTDIATGSIKQLLLRTDSSDCGFPLQELESPLPLDSPVGTPDISISILAPPADDESLESKSTRDQSILEGKSGFFLVPSPDSTGTSASIEKVQTALREEVGGETQKTREKDSLRILGLVHLDMARYHEMGRFSEDSLPDLDSALYHLQKSADCGISESLYTLAHIHRQLPHEEFKELSVKATPEHELKGLEYLAAAAKAGLKPAMLEIAKTLEEGANGLKGLSQDIAEQWNKNWLRAVEWYGKVLSASDTEETQSCVDPEYTILARMAEMYLTGGFQLDKDPQKAGDLYTEAAESAMSAMKGKLSNKYYMLAEEAWSNVSE